MSIREIIVNDQIQNPNRTLNCDDSNHLSYETLRADSIGGPLRRRIHEANSYILNMAKSDQIPLNNYKNQNQMI